MQVASIITDEDIYVHPLLEKNNINYDFILVVGYDRYVKILEKHKDKIIDKNISYCYSIQEGSNEQNIINEQEKFILNVQQSLDFKTIRFIDIDDIPLKECFFYYIRNKEIYIVSNHIYRSNIDFLLFKNNFFDILKESKLQQLKEGSDIEICYKIFNKKLDLFFLQKNIEPWMLISIRDFYLKSKEKNRYKRSYKVWKRAFIIEEKLSNIKVKVDNKVAANIFDDKKFEEFIEYSKTGYVTSIYNGTNKTTGRIFHQKGFNIQNLSGEQKRIIIPEENNFIVEFDYKFFEFSLMQQVVFNKEQKTDPHIDLSILLFGDDTKRDEAKKINYSLLYGAEMDMLLSSLKISNKKNIIKEILLDPLEDFKQKLISEYNKQGFIYNYFDRNINPKEDKNLFNNFIQSSASDFMIKKMLNIFIIQKENKNIKILFQKHDSIIFEISNPMNINLIKKELEKPEKNISFMVDAEIGNNFYEMQKFI